MTPSEINECTKVRIRALTMFRATVSARNSPCTGTHSSAHASPRLLPNPPADRFSFDAAPGYRIRMLLSSTCLIAIHPIFM